jgi:amino acid adenylation domain-containing protein
LLLRDLLKKSFNDNKLNIALEVGNKSYNYSELYKDVVKITNVISLLDKTINNSFIGILGDRSKNVYSGILSIIFSGNTYVPLNHSFPADRLSYMIDFSETNILILCEESIEIFCTFADKIKPIKILIVGTKSEKYKLENSFKQHTFYILSDFTLANEIDFSKEVDNNSLLYLMFTSGSTGRPKAVPVSNKNVVSYLNIILSKYDITSSDRVSQMFDITFDLSVHDIFVAFISGATLCVIPKESVMAPLRFINNLKITIWFSVPSVIMFMLKMKMLKENSMPNLKLSLFCGESLSISLAEYWQKAACNSTIENLYGPTEATIAITSYSYRLNSHYDNSTVPIGKIFPNNKYLILDNKYQSVKSGDEGVLYLSGNQIVDGYLHNSNQTKKSFIELYDNEIWYCTGDVVKENSNKDLIYLGRNDFQVKINGFRVELEEMDNLIRKRLDYPFLVTLPLNFINNKAMGVIILVEGEYSNELVERIFDICKNYLPTYMNPKRIEFIKKLPLNHNGKLDRNKLIKEFSLEK